MYDSFGFIGSTSSLRRERQGRVFVPQPDSQSVKTIGTQLDQVTEQLERLMIAVTLLSSKVDKIASCDPTAQSLSDPTAQSLSDPTALMDPEDATHEDGTPQDATATTPLTTPQPEPEPEPEPEDGPVVLTEEQRAELQEILDGK